MSPARRTAVLGPACVKRRSPPAVAQFTVVAHAAALRRLRMNYSKRNRVTGFPLRSVFSHGLGREPSAEVGTKRVILHDRRNLIADRLWRCGLARSSWPGLG